MTLSEAIIHAEEVAYQKDLESEFETDNERYAMTDNERANCKKCADEHRQLAEWLKELKAYKEQSGDVISRQAAIIQLSHNKNGDDDCDVIVQKDIETIKQLPPAQPERKTGKWILDDEYIDCSACRHEKWSRVPYESLVKRFNFCPNCGADMRGTWNETN